MINSHGYDRLVQWGRMLRSSETYIQEQCDRAREAGAPTNAIYQISGPGGVPTGNRATADGILDETTRAHLGLPLALPCRA